MLVQLETLHSYILQGKSECHVFEAAPSCTGGKVFKNCHHQVSFCYYNCTITITWCVLIFYVQITSATKYIVKKESTRDHVDLLLSCKHWPLMLLIWLKQCGAIAEGVLKICVQKDRHRYKQWSWIVQSANIPLHFILQVVHLPELQHIHSLPVTSSNVALEHNYARVRGCTELLA